MSKVIIDFEFTGLDNSYISNNEIIQFKAMNIETNQTVCENYGSDKDINAYGYIMHKTKRYDAVKFSKEEFLSALSKIGCSMSDTFNGFGITQDKLMLSKYGIDLHIVDIRQSFQLSHYDSKLAIEGSGLETVYYIATNKIPTLNNHNGIDEVYLIKELFDIIKHVPLKRYFEVMPHGHCAGMPISEYVENYRRSADGYRYNNNDLLSDSLSNAINNLIPSDWDDEEDLDIRDDEESLF